MTGHVVRPDGRLPATLKTKFKGRRLFAIPARVHSDDLETVCPLGRKPASWPHRPTAYFAKVGLVAEPEQRPAKRRQDQVQQRVQVDKTDQSTNHKIPNHVYPSFSKKGT